MKTHKNVLFPPLSWREEMRLEQRWKWGWGVRGLVVTALLLYGVASQAQEFTFSQAGLLRNAINPARVADMAEDARATVAYRNQWYAADQPYSTIYASGEGAYRIKDEGSLKRIGAQLSIADDNLARGKLRTQWVQLAGSYTQSLDAARRHQLSGGVGMAVQMRRLDAASLTFDNQFTPQTLGFDPGIASGEQLDAARQTFVQVSVGAAYRFYVSDKLALRADVAFLGINSLNESLLYPKGLRRLYPKAPLERHRLGPATWHPSVWCLNRWLYYNRQGPADEMLAGSWVLFSQSPYARKAMLVGPGLFIRPNDAIIPGVRLELDRFSGAVTYDATYSQARNAARINSILGLGGLGALEISAQYRLWLSRPADGGRSVPCRSF